MGLPSHKSNHFNCGKHGTHNYSEVYILGKFLQVASLDELTVIIA